MDQENLSAENNVNYPNYKKNDQKITDPAPKPKGKHKALLIFIFVLLFGVIGILGYLLYQEKNSSEEVQNVATEQIVAEDTEVKEENTVPDGYTEYKNEEYGFSFNYPERWGEVSVVEGFEKESGHLVNGDEKIVKFSGNPNVIAGVKTKDWQHNDIGHGGTTVPGFISFTESVNQTKEYVTAQDIYLDEDNMFGFVSICNDFCTADHPKTLAQIKVKLDNEKIDGVEIFSYGDVLGLDYLSKETTWNFDAILEAKAHELFPSSDNRYLEIQEVSRSIK